MRRVENLHLWIGNARDVRDPARLFAEDVAAVVDLAYEEEPARLPRDIAYLRFPVWDGEDDSPLDFLPHAVRCVEALIRDEVPTLVACSVGMSRSPAVVAAALARIRGTRAIDEVVKLGRLDLSPGLWTRLVGQTDDIGMR